jgi:hypothetical protein
MYRATRVRQMLTPTYVPHLCFAPILSDVSDSKSGKCREMIARLSFDTPCELGFRGSRPMVNTSWEQLLGSKPTNANRGVNKPGD